MKGLYKKYEVTRTDGGSVEGRKHHECSYFVIDITHDPCAADALLPYALAIEKSNPTLAKDIRYNLERAIVERTWPRQ